MGSLVNEANSDLSHSEMISHLVSFFEDHDWLVFSEFALPEGLRADILIKKPDHEIVIVECKADWRPRETSRSILKYSRFCDRLLIGWNASHGLDVFPGPARTYRLQRSRPYGVLLVDRLGYKTLCDAPKLPLGYALRSCIEEKIRGRLSR